MLDVLTDRGEAAVHDRENRLVGRLERARLGNGSEVPVGVRQRAVHQVAPVGEELVVVAPHELGPREVGVLRLGARRDEVVAERVGVVAVEEVTDEDRVLTARRELLPLHRQELGRDHVVGKLERREAGAVLAARAVPEQDRRPDHRVEDDVVLPLEVGVLGLVVLPPDSRQASGSPRSDAHSMLAER